jgi:hypothetical protein
MVFLPLFSFVSYSLFTIITILTSRFLVPEKRGQLIGGSAFIALLAAALFELIFIGSEFNYTKAKHSLIVVFAVFMVVSFLLLINYFDLRPRGTDLIPDPKAKIELTSIKDMNLIFSLVAASLTFIGSGFLHSIELNHIPEVTLERRAYAFLIAGLIILIVAIASDYIGRFIILISASALTLGSALTAIYSFVDFIIVAFELAGYYLLIIYVLLQLADFISQKIVLISGVGWGMVYSFDFIGAYLGTELGTNNDLAENFMIAIPILLIAFVFLFLVPNILTLTPKVATIMIVNTDGRLLFCKGELEKDETIDSSLVAGLVSALNDFASLVTKKGLIKKIEFEDKSLALFFLNPRFILSVFVNRYSLELQNKAIALYTQLDELIPILTEEIGYKRIKDEQRLDRVLIQYFPELYAEEK